MPVHRIRQQRRKKNAIGDAGGGRHQDVRVAASELRVRLERRVPAQGFRAPYIGGEGVDRACVETVQAEARERHQLAPSTLPISVIALSRTATTRSISGRVMTSGGESTTVLPRWRPPPERPTITPFRRAKSTTPFMRSAGTASFVRRSRTSSIPAKSPLPRTSPTQGCFRSVRSPSSRYAPFSAERSTRRSSRMISMLRLATAAATGWPPYVEIWNTCRFSAGSPTKRLEHVVADDGGGDGHVRAHDALGD